MIPELKLYEYLELLTALITDDLKNEPVMEKTILYQILGKETFKGESYFVTAKELFLRSNEHPRKIQLNYSFILERASLPSISLSTPTESPNSQLNVFGVGEENYLMKEGPNAQDAQYPILSRGYNSSVNIVISSSNFTEQTIMYHVYRSLFISVMSLLSLEGFINPVLSGREVQINPELVPTNIYIRMLVLGFSYKVEVQGATAKYIITKLCEDGPKQILIIPNH